MNLANIHILIVRLSSIGDVLHATVVAHNLKLHEPHCYITWLASPPASELLRYNPDIDELIIWDRNAFEHAFKACSPHELKVSLYKLYHLLSPRSFDIVLDIHGLFLTGVISLLSKAHKRIGIRGMHELNNLFMTELAPKVSNPHKVYQYAAVLHHLGINTLNPNYILGLPPSLDDFASHFFTEHGIDCNQPILMVNPCSTRINKNWPIKSFVQVLDKLPANIQIIFCGAVKDTDTINNIQSSMKHASYSIAGETNLLELAALFRASDLLLTGDTGPLHIAIAVGLNTLSLWGPTRPDIYGPLVPDHAFIVSQDSCTACLKAKCRYHTNSCMKSILPDTVEAKIYELLAITRH